LVKGSDRRGFVAVYSGRNKDYSEIRIARFLQSQQRAGGSIENRLGMKAG